MSQSQKDGVFGAVVAFLDESGKGYEEGVKVELSTEDRNTVIGMLIAATEAGELTVKSQSAQSNLKEYWRGTLSNWLRKDERLNGGVAHQIKNPGSRKHAGDKQLKNMKLMLKHPNYQGEEAQAAINEEIAKREAELEAEKSKKVTIDIDQIPESLRHLISA